METVVEVEVNAEAKFEDNSSAPKSLKLIADPVVYQLVRVEGDGRLVPATDDEVMEVEDLFEDSKSEKPSIADLGKVEYTLINKCSSDRTHLKESQGILQSENLEVGPEKSSAVLDLGVNLVKPNSQTEEFTLSRTPNVNDSNTHQSGGGQCSNHQGGVTESVSLASTVCSSWKPDFSRLKGEICLDNLSVRELQETFEATFGRETTVKDKQWLKRRISMGLTNSFDVSTTTFIIENNRVVKKGKKGKEERTKIVDVKHAKDPVIGAMDENCGGSSSVEKKDMEIHFNGSGKILQNSSAEYDHDSEDTYTEQRAVKRIRKPTRRYIEEVSLEESREISSKLTSQVKNSGHCLSSPETRVSHIRNVRSDGRPLVTRRDSLGGSGIQIPYVSRVRRGRPRENFMALMKLQPSGMGMASRKVKKAFTTCDSQPDTERGNKVAKARLSPGWGQQPLINKPEKAEEILKRRRTELDKDEEALQQTDSSGDNSCDNIATAPTTNGSMRRKHHRPWTLSEVVKLVEGVARYGAGRWSEIKRVSFASYSYRTSVDLKDKWRNLLRASFAQLPADKGVDNSRKHASIPIPAPILVRVRELAEMQAQVPPNLSGGRFAGHSDRSVHETRSGYL